MNMSDTPRLIEYAFPLKQASLDSVHEKNVRHGHISTLHIWPARRPLAACRAALIVTLLPDPGSPEERRKLCEKIGGKVVKKVEKKRMPNGRVVERIKEQTEGGILHWKRETENTETLEWFRQEIRKAYGGRMPRVLDPFAGGGAIPLEAMRLGCEVAAVDINPVAWFILKCTLEYPQKLAGKTHPLPDFILRDRDFMLEFLEKVKGYSKSRARKILEKFGHKNEGEENGWLFELDEDVDLQGDLAWHVRAWGQWVLDRARRELAKFYPIYADFEPLDKANAKPYEKQDMRLVLLKDDGTPDIDALNAEFSKEYLADKCNPRWVAKPTVAYLWARTVQCKNCRATVPLLKTRWLCKKRGKRVLLTMGPNADKTGVIFGVENDVPEKGGNAAQKREHDKRTGAGTMSRAGAKCPCCGTIMTMEDLRAAGKSGHLSSMPTAVVVDGQKGKEYRLPTEHEVQMATEAGKHLDEVFAEIPFGVPNEPTPAGGGSGAGRAFSVQGYGLMRWRDLFTPRQLLALGVFVKHARAARDEMAELQYPPEWVESLAAYLAIQNDKVADYNSMVCVWHISGEKIGHTFTRFALPITWDFTELAVTNTVGGGYSAQLDWLARFVDHALVAAIQSEKPIPLCQSAIRIKLGEYDAIVTDPPYYDAIPYSDLMDFFYIWLKRSLSGVAPEFDAAFKEPLSPKWNDEENDGELIDDASRHGRDNIQSKSIYEMGMARAFRACNNVLKSDGRLIVVFANKQPDAWEALVTALIRAGFVVDGSWPIQTEMNTRMRAKTSAALASSIWLVCKKRPATARPGWDNRVLEEMRANITTRLREFWDAGIRGPDFVWAATGPALEAYSKHPVVKKANVPGQVMTVGEFLIHIRRMVVDFVVGQMLTGDGNDADLAAADRMDAPTAYYLLHRHDFGLGEAPSGACILYAVSCGLSDRDLETTWNLLARTGGKGSSNGDEDEQPDPDADAEVGTDSGLPAGDPAQAGSKVKLRTWAQRKHKSMGYEAPDGQPVPLIDRVHRLMHLWKAGDVHKVDEYLDDHGLRRHELFKRLLQSLIELSRKDACLRAPHRQSGSQELQVLESLSNHVQAKGAVLDQQKSLFDEDEGV